MNVRKKKRTGDLQAILFLALIFFAGFAIGGRLTELMQNDEPKPQPAVSYYEKQLEPEAEAPVANEEPILAPKPETTDLGEFKLTAYCPCEKCNGIWVGQPTASGTELTPGRTIAVDPKVIPLGTTVIINGSEYVAEDTGSAIKGNRIDVLFPTHEEALEFGVQYADVSIKN